MSVPVTGPGSQAEVAPVPGQGSNQANLSALGLADSGTVGSGGEGAVADGSIPTPPAGQDLLTYLAPGHAVAQQSHCVGNPPRQTEDPLSPPCIAFWKGDNHGPTMHGVTGDSIIAVEMDHNYAGTDYNAPISASDSPFVRTTKVFLRYFQRRFQTYQRVVQLKGYYYKTTATPTQSVISPFARDVVQKYNPFAVIGPYPGGGYEIPIEDFPRSQVFAFAADTTIHIDTGLIDQERAEMNRLSPYFWSLQPELEDLSAAATRWVCRSVVGKPAAMAGDPTLAATTRRIALIYGRNPDDGSNAQHFAASVKAECGYQFPQVLQYDDNTNGQSVAQTAAAKMFTDHDTTWLCYMCTSLNSYFTRQLAAQAYIPEPMFVAWSYDDNFYGRQMSGPETANASGITWRWRLTPIEQTYWWNAYKEIDPAGSPDTFLGYTIYEELLQLFSAIQLAGPTLNPSSVEKGMRTWSRAGLDGGFSPKASYAGFSHGFITDYAWERWNSTASPPGGARTDVNASGNAGGCYEQVDNGRRFDGTDWPTTDDALQGGPCTADNASNADGSSDTSGHAAPGS